MLMFHKNSWKIPILLAELIIQAYSLPKTGTVIVPEGYRLVCLLQAVAKMLPELFGFIIESDKSAVIIFRGTSTLPDWVEDFSIDQIDFPYAFNAGKTHEGFTSVYQSTRDQIFETITKLGPDKRIYLSGHSLGAALATLAVLDIAENTGFRQPVMYNFGSPRVGDGAFAEYYNNKISNSLRFVNLFDLVPHFPLHSIKLPFNDKTVYYQHVSGSYLFAANTGNFEDNHSMQTYLRALAISGKPLIN